MDIGTVVNIRITGVVRTCVILDRKPYYDLCCGWTNSTLKYLKELYRHDGLFVNTDPFFPDELRGFSSNGLCYELMYGDSKVWIKDDRLEEHGKEI